MSAEPGSAAGSSPEPPAVRVVRTVQAPVGTVWDALVSDAGTQALLGPGALLGGKGEPWRSDDGPSGVLRSYHPQEQLRWSWHETPDAPATLVELDLHDDGTTRLDLRHDGVDPGYATHWSAALDRWQAAVGP